jgi:ParB family transcriptional regulator, chromosome partitioning protein
MSTYRVVPLSSLSAPEAPLRHAMERESLDELARSIATVGLLQPLTVKAAPSGYEVVAGHRRLLACRMVGLAEVPVMIREDDTATEAAVMLVENIQRADLSPIEEARALKKGREVLSLSIEQLAAQASRSEAWVRQRLELLDWPLLAIEALAERRATVAALKPLMEVEDVTERDRLLACAIDSGATAQVTRVWAQQARGFASTAPEGLSGRSSALLGVGDVVVSMPCYSCRVPKDAFSLQVLRVCRECIADMEAAVAASAASQGVGG